MNLRAVTVFLPLEWPLQAGALEPAVRTARVAREVCAEEGLTLQTVRAAGPPLNEALRRVPAGRRGEDALAYARALDAAAAEAGLDYVSAGPARPDDPWMEQRPLFEALPELVLSTERLSCTVQVGDGLRSAVHLGATAMAARAIHRIAHGPGGGFSNLRFAALSNCPPGIPFFPAAYHDSGPPAFAFAVEAADLVVEAFSTAGTLQQALARLADLMTAMVNRLERLAARIAHHARMSLRFLGVDLSPAPFPEAARSIAEALERLGVAPFGAPGTLFAAALLTAALRRARVARAGFSGLMLPVLEDAILAQRAAQGVLSLDRLLLCSAVCGLGLDTVPLPGDISEAALTGIILDMAVLAVRLDKPLTARLFPVPGARAGDEVRFDFSYFAPSRVLAVPEPASMELVTRGGEGWIEVML